MMGIAETVTLGGGGRDRGQALRADPAAVAALLAEGRVLALWRGRPLCTDTGAGGGLGWLPPGHPVLQGCAPPVFLGLAPDGRGDFAADLPHWQPDEGPAPAGPFDPGLIPHPDAPPGHAFADLRFAMTRLSAVEQRPPPPPAP